MFEVLETSWGSLHERLDSARNLDDLINAHKTYLSDIMCRALLHDDSRDISAKLEEVTTLLVFSFFSIFFCFFFLFSFFFPFRFAPFLLVFSSFFSVFPFLFPFAPFHIF